MKLLDSLACEKQTSSIYSLGKNLQNASRCNMWTFWHYDAAGEVKPIDVVRQVYLLSVED